ncbi:MAG TPA: sulfite exporter TauE/SafE family protein [Pyrinomonadaceae bacterium]
MSLAHGALMFAAAFVAGGINSIAGGGTLVTFPVLLWLGLDPKVANATSTVALWPGFFGGVFGFRREISDSREHLLWLGITSLIGGAVGAALLILTPSQTFASLVPFLILFATLLFTLQEQVSRRLRLHERTTSPTGARRWVGPIIVQLFASIYGGYFGAGNSILILATLGLFGLTDIHRANGIKNFLGICINSVAVLAFALSSLVYWPDALLMMVGAIAGGYYGASAARRLGRTFVRRTVVLIGLVIGVIMLWRIS